MTDISVLKLADLRTVATETSAFSMKEAMVHVYTKTAGIGMQLSRISEQLPCAREPGNSKDPFAVAVVRSSVISCPWIIHTNVLSMIVSRVCTSAAASDWAWLTRILNLRKLFP